MEMRTTPRVLLDELEAASIPYEVIAHRHTDTALEEADALGIEAFRVAKTIILSTPDGFVRAVLPACEHLDLAKARDVVGSDDVSVASDEVVAGLYPEYEPGAVPPFPGTTGDAVFVDGRLDKSQFVVIAAGTHHESVSVKISDLVAATNALLCDLCEERSKLV